jgi:multisubunit Na+/H+ antiporter MnhG subunit
MKKRIYVFLSLLCAVGVFIMSSVFQNMVNWGEGLTWYWIGVTFTYFIWLLGIILLVITRKSNWEGKLLFGLPVLWITSFIILIFGFFWTTFIIMAGLSGM